MGVTIYHYPKCGTCRKAIKWLEANGIEVESSIDIKENPPSAAELARIIQQSGLEPKKFFNTSGVVYKEQQLKDKIPALSEQQQIELLSSNGMLIKRPLITDGKKVTIGFKEEEMERIWK